jgi:hypothetical protein
VKCFPLRLSPRSNVVDPQCCTGMCHLEGHTCPWVDRICNDKPVPAPKPSAWAWFKNRLATLRDDLVSFLEQPCPWE